MHLLLFIVTHKLNIEQTAESQPTSKLNMSTLSFEWFRTELNAEQTLHNNIQVWLFLRNKLQSKTIVTLFIYLNVKHTHK